jgi:hypothetical protein
METQRGVGIQVGLGVAVGVGVRMADGSEDPHAATIAPLTAERTAASRTARISLAR